MNEGEFEAHTFQAKAGTFSNMLAQAKSKSFFLPFPSTESKSATPSMDKSKSVRSNLISLGFSEINIARKDRIQSWQKSYALLEEKIQAGKIGNAEIEYEATVILRDLRLLSDASAKAKTSIKKLLV